MHFTYAFTSQIQNQLLYKPKNVMTSPRAPCHSKIKMSKIEGPAPSSTSMDGHEPRRENHSKGITRSHNNGFSFDNH